MYNSQFNPQKPFYNDTKNSQVRLNPVNFQRQSSVVSLNNSILSIPSSNENDNHKEYDPDAIPPNFELAFKHQQANKVSPDYQLNTLDYIPEMCPCCSRQVQRQDVKINCPSTELSFLGSGYPLYFEFLKYQIIILLTFLIFSGLYNLLSSSIKGRDCINNPLITNICQLNWITKLTPGNRISNKFLFQIQEYLNFVCILALILILYLQRKSQLQVEIECDVKNISAQDYSLLLTNYHLPDECEDYQQDLKNYLENNALPQKFVPINKLNFIFNLSTLVDLNAQKDEVIKQKQFFLQKQQEEQQYSIYKRKIKKLNLQIKQLNQQIYQFEKDCAERKDSEFLDQYLSKQVIVSFQTEQDKEEILRKYQYSFFQRLCYGQEKLYYNGYELNVQDVASPSDINWYHLHLKKREQIFRFLVSIVITIFSLAICFILIFWMLYLQNSYNKEPTIIGAKQNTAQNKWISIVISIMIVIFNQVLIKILETLADYEKNETKTHYKISLSKKLAWAQFFNTSVITFIINVIIQGKDNAIGNIFGMSGLTVNQNTIFLTNMILPFIMNIINIPYIIRFIQRKQYERQKEKCLLTQQQLNELYENPNFNIPVKYSSIINTIFSTAFYAPVLPIALVWSIIAIYLQYVSQKRQLLKQTTVKSFTGSDLPFEMIEQVEYVLPIFIISNIMFTYFISNYELSIICLLSLIIGIVNAIIPVQGLVNLIHPKQELDQLNIVTYDQAELDFDDDYDRCNPITQKQATQVYLSKVQLNQKLKNIEHSNAPYLNAGSKIIFSPKGNYTGTHIW